MERLRQTNAGKPDGCLCRAFAGELNVAALESALQGEVAAARQEVAALQEEVQDLEMQQQSVPRIPFRKPPLPQSTHFQPSLPFQLPLPTHPFHATQGSRTLQCWQEHPAVIHMDTMAVRKNLLALELCSASKATAQLMHGSVAGRLHPSKLSDRRTWTVSRSESDITILKFASFKLSRLHPQLPDEQPRHPLVGKCNDYRNNATPYAA